MQMPNSYEFFVGLTVGKILLGTVLTLPLLRNIALVGASIGICIVYFREGIIGIISAAHSIQLDFLSRPDFSKGIIVGAAVSAVAVGIFRWRNAP
jgi:hypothetical protein